MHSIHCNYSAVNFAHFFKNSSTNVNYTLRDADNFFVMRTNVNLVEKMPIVDFPKIWNSLDNCYKNISTRLAFKKTIKADLLEKYRNFKCSKTLCLSCMNL